MWPLPRRVRLELRFQPDSPRQRRCPKHVEYRDKIKFWILDASFGYLYEDYRDARSLEHKVNEFSSNMCKSELFIFRWRLPHGFKYTINVISTNVWKTVTSDE